MVRRDVSASERESRIRIDQVISWLFVAFVGVNGKICIVLAEVFLDALINKDDDLIGQRAHFFIGDKLKFFPNSS